MKQQYFETMRGNLAIRGMLAIPDGACKEHPVPMVLLLHGFTGTRSEFQFIYHRLARLLAEEGIASVRFDFTGSGDSDGEFRDMSPLTERDDAICVLSAVSTLPFVDASRIAVSGMSMGGLVACLTAAEKPDAIRCLNLWSPALCISDNCRDGCCQDVSIAGMERDGYVDFHGYQLGLVFKNDALSFDVYDAIRSYKGPIHVIHGEADDCVPPAYSKRLADVMQSTCSLVTIPGAGHTYASIPAATMLLSHTISYLKKELF